MESVGGGGAASAVSSLALSMACKRRASGRSVRMEISGREEGGER
jgi:hypothetical protein